MPAPPPVLIFLPVRNGGDLVTNAIASVIAQTHRDWRLVVLENASDDGTPGRLRAMSDPRIEIIAAPISLGIEANWRRGLEFIERQRVTDETLITFLGHDDLLYPNFLSEILALRRDHPAATLYQTHFDLIDGAGALIRACRPIPRHEGWEDLLAALCWSLRDSFGTGYVFRAADYRHVAGIPSLPSLLYADHLLFIRLTRLGYKVCSPAGGFAYRLRRGSMSNGVTRRQRDAHLAALTQFVEAVSVEFAPFLENDAGRAAVVTLLARGLFAHSFRPNGADPSLAKLRELYGRYARGIPMSAINGTTVSSSTLVARLRAVNLAIQLGRDRLRRQR